MTTNQPTRTQPAHTPGPWKATPVTGGVWEIDHNPGYNWKAVCTVGPNSLGQSRVTPLEAEANARLIAAAPDLLAACKDVELIVRQHAERYPGDRDAARLYDQLRSAIARAEGGEA